MGNFKVVIYVWFHCIDAFRTVTNMWLHDIAIFKIVSMCFIIPQTPSAIIAGEIERGPHLRPGHYTVKSKKHGFECLRCGMKGYIRDIMETTCSNPHVTPQYYDEDTKDTNVETTGSCSDETLLKDELMALQLLEQEFQLLEAIEAEQAILDDLSLQCAALAAEEETDQKKQEITKRMVDDLVIMGFSQDMAIWAVQESKSEWGRAVELAQKRIQEEEHALLEKQGEEEHAKKTALRRRKPATPCKSTSMPPPPVPAKRVKKKSSVTTADTPVPAPVCSLIWFSYIIFTKLYTVGSRKCEERI